MRRMTKKEREAVELFNRLMDSTQKRQTNSTDHTNLAPAPAPPPAYAPSLYEYKINNRWRHVANSDDEGVFYDTKTIKRRGSVISVWLRYQPYLADLESVREKKKEDNSGSSKYDSYSYELVHFELNCSDHQVKLMEYIDYDENGDIITDLNFPPTWDDDTPESVIEEVSNILCQKY